MCDSVLRNNWGMGSVDGGRGVVEGLGASGLCQALQDLHSKSPKKGGLVLHCELCPVCLAARG